MRIRGLEGLGGLGLGYEWLAGLVWEGLGGRVVGLLCMGRNGAGSNLAVHFDFFSFFPCRIFLSVDRSHLR